MRWRCLGTLRWEAVEWYDGEDGPEDSSSMDTNQSGDVYQNDIVGLERLEDWKDTICSEGVQADWISEQGHWGGSEGMLVN